MVLYSLYINENNILYSLFEGAFIVKKLILIGAFIGEGVCSKHYGIVFITLVSSDEENFVENIH